MKKLYFIAIIFEKEIEQRIAALKKAAGEQFDSYKALRSPAHITLVPPFSYEEDELQALMQIVESVELKNVRLGLYGLGSFGKKVIFIKTDNQIRLKQLKKELDKKLEPFEIKTKMKKFYPHITLAFRDLHEDKFEPAFHYFKNKSRIGVSKHCRIAVLESTKSGWQVLEKHQL